MSILNIQYIISGKERTIDLDLSKKNEWTFLDDLDLNENDTFNINNDDFKVSFDLNLYKKRHNLHIFSAYACEEHNYFNLDFPFYLVWVNNSNVYALIQENKKSNDIRDDLNGIKLRKESLNEMFRGLFKEKPTYFEESNSRCKSIKNLEELPKNGAEVRSFEETDPVTGKVSSYASFVPI